MSKIITDGLTNTVLHNRYFIAVYHYGNSGRQRVKTRLACASIVWSQPIVPSPLTWMTFEYFCIIWSCMLVSFTHRCAVVLKITTTSFCSVVSPASFLCPNSVEIVTTLVAYMNCNRSDRIYRVAQKSKPQTLVQIFAKYWPIFKIFFTGAFVENV